MGPPPRSGTCRAADRSGRAWPRPTRPPSRACPGVRSVEIRGDRVLIQTMDSDAVAQVPAVVDGGTRRGDRGPQPRGRVPRPDRGRARGQPTEDRPADGDVRREREARRRPCRSPERRLAAARWVQPHLPVDRGPPSAAQPADRGRDRGRARGPVPAVQDEQAKRGAGWHRAHDRHDDDRHRRVRRDARRDLGRRHGLDRTGAGLEPSASAHATAPGCLRRASRSSWRCCWGWHRSPSSTSSVRSTACRWRLPTWITTAILAWGASLVFASFGLFMGYLLPSENVMQVIGPILAVFALFGGLFVPLSLLPSVMQTIAPAHADVRRRVHRPLPARRGLLRSDLAVERRRVDDRLRRARP